MLMLSADFHLDAKRNIFLHDRSHMVIRKVTLYIITPDMYILQKIQHCVFEKQTPS